MNCYHKCAVALLCLALPTGFSVTSECNLAQEKTASSATPLQGRLIAKKALYTLDLGGKTPEQFRQQLKESRQTGSWPPPPEVDLALELRNGGEKELQLWVGGDVTELLLDLKGPGVVKAHGTKFFTGQTLHETVRLAPGKRYTVPIARLSYGLRGANHLAYWT